MKNITKSILILLPLFLLINTDDIAFSADIEDHGTCEYSELPEDFNGSPPPDRTDFDAGEYVCVWLLANDYQSDREYDVVTDWYMPDGSKLPYPISTRKSIRFNSELDKIFMSVCLMSSGEDSVEGIPEVPGEWLVKVFDNSYYQRDYVFEENFTVRGDSTTTTINQDDDDDYDPDDDCLARQMLGANDPRLETIRQFRNGVLAKNAMGKKLIKLYYNNAGTITAALENHPMLKQFAQKILEASVPAMKVLMKK